MNTHRHDLLTRDGEQILSHQSEPANIIITALPGKSMIANVYAVPHKVEWLHLSLSI